MRVPIPLVPFVAVAAGIFRAGRLMWRSVVAVVLLPSVLVDERVARINHMRTATNVLASEANLNVARIGEILCSRGRSDAGKDCIDSVIRAMFPKPTPINLSDPRTKETDAAAQRAIFGRPRSDA